LRVWVTPPRTSALTVNSLYLADESKVIGILLNLAECSPDQVARIESAAVGLVEVMRRGGSEKSGLDAFLDAEEADRLELTLEIFEAVYTGLGQGDRASLGIVVQAYQRRALSVIEWLDALSTKFGRRIPVRLVKGAYWDEALRRGYIYACRLWPERILLARRAVAVC